MLAGDERSPLAATPFIAAAAFASFGAAGSVVTLGSWLERPALAVAIVTAVIMLTRVATRSRSIPTLAGAATTFLVLIPLFARGEDGGRFLLPTPAAVSALFRSFGNGSTFAEDAVRPLPVDHDFAALLSLAVLAFFVAVEHLAVSWRAVGTAGLILLAPWVPAIVRQQQVDLGILVVALASWVLALALSRGDTAARRRVAWTTSALGSVAALVLAILVVPSAVGGAGWGAIPGRYTPDLFDGRDTQLNLEVDLRNSLTANSEAPVFAYASSAGRSDAFRVYSFTDFDGSQWQYSAAPVTTHAATDTLLWTLPVDDWSTTDHTVLSVAILSLSASNLPVPVAPRTVNVIGPWFYDPDTDQIAGDDTTTHDLRYTLVVDFPYQNADALRESDGRLALGQVDDLRDPAYVEIPPTLDLARVLALTREVTAGATTRYDQALAIQQYLRDPKNFVYDTSVTSTSGDAVGDFLDSHHGYCIQFATTMVMMLRSIGIPSRLGEGFLPGTLDGETYVVRGADAHAWPEVYFPGHGWVRFEPTPAIQTGEPPSWANPDGADSAQEDVPPGGLPDNDQGGLPPVPVGSGGGLPVALIVGIALAAVAAGAGALFWFRRGGRSIRSRGGLRGPEAAWARLNRALGNRGWPASATPREAAEHVLMEIRVARKRPAGPEPESALRALSSAVEDQRYAPAPPTIETSRAEAWADEVAREATPEDAAKGRPAPDDARSAPRDDS